MKRFAIFFPQYYQVAINDIAWGQEFTDWVLVAAANAFDSWTRRAPACGFYDLSKVAVIAERFEAAAAAGLDGFGIYHYRFEDGPELDSVERYLHKSSIPEKFSYFFIWANEDWSRRWVNDDTRILKTVPKAPTREQVVNHVKYLKPYMESVAYTKISGKPMFVVYRPDWFEDPAATIELYKQEFGRLGVSVSIGFFVKNAVDIKYSELFDFCYIFEPRTFLNFQGLRKNKTLANIYKKSLGVFSPERSVWISEYVNRISRRGHNIFTFAAFLSYFKSAEREQLTRTLRCDSQNILPSGWNNTPRYRKHFTQLEVPNAEQFSAMLELALRNPNVLDEIPLLCNAWNEWSEGAAIEPCAYLGDALLKAYLSLDERGEKAARL